MKMFKILYLIDFLLIVITSVFLTYSSVNAENLDSRIIGGNPANKKLWPFIVAISNKRKCYCAGSLIHPSWILTAAHCVPYNESEKHYNEIMYGPARIRLGLQDIQYDSSLVKNMESGVKRIKKSIKEAVLIEEYYIHPNYILYKGTDLDDKYMGLCINDLALIKVPDNIKIPESVKPIGIAKTPVKDKSSCITAGWGHSELLDSDKEPTDKNILYELEMFIDVPMCKEFTKRNKLVLSKTSLAGMNTMEHVLCAKSKSMWETPYYGDSGGPVICNNKLHGVLSNIRINETGKQKTFYTFIIDVFTYTNWINEVIFHTEAYKRNFKNNALSSGFTVILLMMYLIYLYRI